MNRKAVAYLRFSSEEQSSHSIERQQMITGSWMQHFNVELVDSFEDQGYTATNFDRPDFKKLYAFIGKDYRNIDYLVVSDLTRFIAVNSSCEHHFVPIIGKAHVAYISSGKVIGLSKLNRIVKYFSQRPQVQERLTMQVANEQKKILKTEDVAVF